jgi:hypothetical protein
MTIERVHFVASMSGQPDYHEDFVVRHYNQPTKEVAANAVRHWKLTTPRSAPKDVTVVVARLTIENNSVVRRGECKVSVTPPLTRMTSEEYAVRMVLVLQPLPVAFRGWVEQQAYDRGHSAGYEEVVMLAEELVDGLLGCINAQGG